MDIMDIIIMTIIPSVFVGGILYALGRQKYSSISIMILGSSVALPLFLWEFVQIDLGHSFGIWFGAWIIVYIYFLKKHRGILEKLDTEFGKKKSKK